MTNCLGIVFREGQDLLNVDDALKPLVTLWGADPIWDGSPISDRAEMGLFKDFTESLSGLPLLAESSANVSVVGYPVKFDAARRLRFADIRINTDDAYWPFVRLALARFQPKSVDGAHLSRVVRADFIQLPPRRQAEITINPGVMHLKVGGPVYVNSEVIDDYRYEASFHLAARPAATASARSRP